MANDDALLEVTIFEGPEDAMVRVRGEVDLSTVSELATALEGVAERGDVLLDLSQLDFIDASGLRALVQADRRLRHEGHRLVISEPPPMALRLLEITRLMHVLDIESVHCEPLLRRGAR